MYILQLGSYTMAGQLYHGRVQGVSVHSTSHLHYNLIVVHLNCTLGELGCTKKAWDPEFKLHAPVHTFKYRDLLVGTETI